VRISSLSEDFTGVRQDVLLDLYIYKDVTISTPAFGAHSSAQQFHLSDAVTMIRVRLGDFGLFLNGVGSYPWWENSDFVRNRLVYEGFDYVIPNELPLGPTRTLSDEVIRQEALIE